MIHHRKRRSSLLSHVARRSHERQQRSRALQRQHEQRQHELEEELRTARDVQQGLLLEAVPHLSGWDISAVSLPARDLGGDLYDFLPVADGIYGVMVGDVSGKGLPAALRMAVARTVFRYQARQQSDPARTLAAANHGVLSEIPQAMVTMLYAVLDLRDGRMRIANAGHTFPVLIQQHITECDVVGLPLGIDGESTYEARDIILEPGDCIVLYSDGVIEMLNEQDAIFSYERLEAVLHQARSLPPRSLIARLLAELRAWSTSQSDDITVVAVRRRFRSIGDELAFTATDVLGSMLRWESLPLPPHDAPVTVWLAHLPVLVDAVRQQVGRGVARELQGQLRIVLESYRPTETRPGAWSDVT